MFALEDLRQQLSQHSASPVQSSYSSDAAVSSFTPQNLTAEQYQERLRYRVVNVVDRLLSQRGTVQKCNELMTRRNLEETVLADSHSLPELGSATECLRALGASQPEALHAEQTRSVLKSVVNAWIKHRKQFNLQDSYNSELFRQQCLDEGRVKAEALVLMPSLVVSSCSGSCTSISCPTCGGKKKKKAEEGETSSMSAHPVVLHHALSPRQLLPSVGAAKPCEHEFRPLVAEKKRCEHKLRPLESAAEPLEKIPVKQPCREHKWQPLASQQTKTSLQRAMPTLEPLPVAQQQRAMPALEPLPVAQQQRAIPTLEPLPQKNVASTAKLLPVMGSRFNAVGEKQTLSSNESIAFQWLQEYVRANPPTSQQNFIFFAPSDEVLRSASVKNRTEFVTQHLCTDEAPFEKSISNRVLLPVSKSGKLVEINSQLQICEPAVANPVIDPSRSFVWEKFRCRFRVVPQENNFMQ
jgi:hypothetical protein